MKKCLLILFFALCICAVCQDAVPSGDAVVVRIFVTSIKDVYREYYSVTQVVNLYVIKRIGSRYFYSIYSLQFDPVDLKDYESTLYDPQSPCKKDVSSYNIVEKKKLMNETELRIVDGMFVRSDIDILQEKIISFYIKEEAAIKNLQRDWVYIKLFNAVPLTK